MHDPNLTKRNPLRLSTSLSVGLFRKEGAKVICLLNRAKNTV